tara:strand:- start:285 stop:1325 length:1041 start_codon:yes stop_codon:yes gene_type:complete
MIDLKLLSKICETPGVPGYEKKIRNEILKEIKDHVDDFYIDNIGNLVTKIKGKKNKKVMVAAHMDEIGFITTHIEKNGFIRFHTLGGFDPKTLTAQRVIVHGKKNILGVMGTKPIHVMSLEEKKTPPKISDFFIDTGMSKKEVDKNISIGDTITRKCNLIEMGDCVSCKSLDNRISVFILIEVLKKIKNPPYDFYGVFTVQEEVGLRGAMTSTLDISPDFGFGLDTTIAFDVPGAQDYQKITELGKGVAVKVMDSSTICDYRMIKYMKKTAQKFKIKFQKEILTAGGTDTAGLQRMTPGGSIAGALSIPTRHIHSHVEMVNKKDVQETIKLLEYCIKEIDTYNWEH